MYTIDLVTLLQLLGEFHRNGILRTELLPALPGLNQRCYVVAELKNGVMVACSVRDAQGHLLLADQKAFQAVSAAGNLGWILEEAPAHETVKQRNFSGPLPPSSRRVTDPLRHTNPLQHTTDPLPLTPLSSLPTSPLPEQPTVLYASFIPQQRMYLSNADINHWPRKYRQIYILIDGERSVAKIAAMLSLSLQAVADVLRDLQSHGVIVLG